MDQKVSGLLVESEDVFSDTFKFFDHHFDVDTIMSPSYTIT